MLTPKLCPYDGPRLNAILWACSFLFLALLLPIQFTASAKSKPAVDWIEMRDGHLVYGTDAHGNRIPDFSTAGYGGGGVPIPDVSVRATLDPVSTGDDTPRIQAAIDKLAKEPLDPHGFRGAILLRNGTYRISGTVLLNASGIVLRGEGNGESGTVLLAQGTPHTVIRVGGSGSWQREGAEHAVVDDYVPVGANVIAIDDASELHVGDRVIVEWRMTAEWIHANGMDRIPHRKDGRGITQWQPGWELRFDRRIVALAGNRVTLDAALTNAMSRSEATLWPYSFAGRISQAGVENLRSDASAFEKSSGFSDPDFLTEGDHPKFVGGGYFDSVFVGFDAVEDAWMRNVALAHYTGLVTVHQSARAITIEEINGDHIETSFTHAPPEAFSLTGQQTLVQHCNIRGAYSHAWATQARVAGPNVFRSCTAKGTHMDAGPHQRWATGTLYEDLHIDGPIDIGNRGNMGTGHGWAGASNVLWNSETESYRVESPPVAYNWAFGNRGSLEGVQDGDADGQIVSHGKSVQPRSLYDEQLRERLAQK
jgi:hypothetical protein